MFILRLAACQRLVVCNFRAWADSQYGVINKTDPIRKASFRNSAYYVSPLMYLLEVVLDDACSDRSPFDVGWTSEFDPSWSDDQLALIKMPIATLSRTLQA